MLPNRLDGDNCREPPESLRRRHADMSPIQPAELSSPERISDIEIVDVEAIALRLPTFDATRTDSSRDALIIRVSTNVGAVGYGEVDSSPTVVKAIVEAPPSHTIARGLRELLVGRDPLDVERIWHDMYEATLYVGRSGVVMHAMAGIDLALWDLKGKLLGQPVHNLLGGAHRTEIRAYASNMFQFTTQATAERAREAVAAGFTAVKFGWEPFGTDAEMDVALVAAIRNAVGSDVDVAIDAGLAWDARTAISRAKLLEPYRPFWIEEPLHPDNLRGYARVSESVNVPIAAGEEECTRDGFRRLMDEGRIDIVQIDVTRTGLTLAKRIADDAHQRGLSVANHCFTTDLNAAASLHFLAATPNALICEYCVEPSELSRALVRNPISIVDGMAQVPEGPGFGIELSDEVVGRYRWAD
jgi:L-alanine-DL-glutamate epimerase-like enolase superfamily enzyme